MYMLAAVAKESCMISQSDVFRAKTCAITVRKKNILLIKNFQDFELFPSDLDRV